MVEILSHTAAKQIQGIERKRRREAHFIHCVRFSLSLSSFFLSVVSLYHFRVDPSQKK